MIHLPSSNLISVHRRLGDARLLRYLHSYSVGQSANALQDLLEGSSSRSVTQSAEKLAEELGIMNVRLITILDSEYPACFRALDKEAPPILYVMGSVERLKTKAIAIIGTRRPTAAGKIAARSVTEFVCRSGWCVVSGNAPGVDGAAHEAAVKCGGETLIFPPAPMDKYQQVFRGDCPEQITVVSPFPPGTSIEPWMFLRRNSLVARICLGAFVAETATRGGTLDTIKKLHRFHRPVFATRLPKETKNSKAHMMLVAGGVRLMEVENGDSPDMGELLTAAENCPKGMSSPIPVLDDFFSGALHQND